MEVEQPVAPLSPSAEEAPTLSVYANGGLVETPADDVVDDAPEEPVSEASAATEEQPPASPKPKATVSPDAKRLKKIASSPLKGSATTKSGTTPSGAGAPLVRKVAIILHLHHPHLEFSLNLPWLIPRVWPSIPRSTDAFLPRFRSSALVHLVPARRLLHLRRKTRQLRSPLLLQQLDKLLSPLPPRRGNPRPPPRVPQNLRLRRPRP
jgi:hypothetical protein